MQKVRKCVAKIVEYENERGANRQLRSQNARVFGHFDRAIRLAPNSNSIETAH